MKVKNTMMALGAATVFLMPAAAAQAFDGAAKTQTQAERPATTAIQISDEKLEEFAAVHKDVESMNAEYQQKIAEAKDVTEKSVLTAEANKEMLSLVEKSDLSLTEYNQIAQMVKQDPVLQSKYTKILND